MGGGMDSTLIFQDAIDCIYTVLQLVAGDKAYPEKVFQEGKCYIGVAWISLCAWESPWEHLCAFLPPQPGVWCHSFWGPSLWQLKSFKCFFPLQASPHQLRVCPSSLQGEYPCLSFLSLSLPFLLGGRGSGARLLEMNPSDAFTGWATLKKWPPLPQASVSPSGKWGQCWCLFHIKDTQNGSGVDCSGSVGCCFLLSSFFFTFLPVLPVLSCHRLSLFLNPFLLLYLSLSVFPSFLSSLSSLSPLPSFRPVFLSLPISIFYPPLPSFFPSSCSNVHPTLLDNQIS